MAYQNKTQVSLSAVDQTALNSYIANNSGSGGTLSGLTPAQKLAVLNGPISINNPQPQAMIEVTEVPKQVVLTVLTSAIFTLDTAGNQKVQGYRDLLASVSANTTDPISVKVLQQYIQQGVADGAITPDEVNQFILTPDSSYQPQIELSPWPLWGLSTPTVLQITDIN